jgi:hypothetical protein
MSTKAKGRILSECYIVSYSLQDSQCLISLPLETLQSFSGSGFGI